MAEGGVSVLAGYAAFVVNIEPTPDSIDNDFRSRPSGREDISNLIDIFNTLGLECINEESKDHQNLAVSQWDHRRAIKKQGEQSSDSIEDQGGQSSNCIEERVGQSSGYLEEQGGHSSECIEEQGGQSSNYTEEQGGQSSECIKNPCLRCRIKSKDHSRSKCFLLALSSHGREITETEIMFSDGESIKLNEIFDALSDKNCPTLTEIPRIILLLACRGNFKDPERNRARQDSGVPVTINTDQHGEEGLAERMENSHRVGTSTTTSNIEREGQSTTQSYTLQHLTLHKMPNNFLLVYPAVSGQLNYSNEIDGTWLVHEMRNALSDYMNTTPVPKSINFFHLLTNTTRLVSLRESEVWEKDKHGKIRKNNKGEPIKDKEKSGLKNAVCSHHRLVEDLILNLHAEKKIPNPKII